MFRISKAAMDTSLERIRAKIAELEAKIADLRIAERKIRALEKLPSRKTRPGPGPKPKPKPKRKPEASNQAEVRQTIGSAIAEHIRATGPDISNRTVSFSLQSLKKRGLAKSADGKWALPKADSRRVRS